MCVAQIFSLTVYSYFVPAYFLVCIRMDICILASNIICIIATTSSYLLL